MTEFFSEMGKNNDVRPAYKKLVEWLNNQDPAKINLKQQEAEVLFRRIGITFSVYGDEKESERLIPFDIMPRVFTAQEWDKLEQGIIQRATALNAFLSDVYKNGEILKAGVIPAKLVHKNTAFEKSMVGFSPACDVFSHIIGIDLVRTSSDQFYVLEDNCRTPSGASYMIENREMMMRLFPQLFRSNVIRPVEEYPSMLRRMLRSVAPAKCQGEPTIVVLTPGPFNSAYFEHSFLADQMGVELVSGRSLYVENDLVYMRTTRGPKRVDVIYRRIDDEFLDPNEFNPKSMLGVPGLINAYKSGGVQICSAPGAGIADDKAIYTYVPDMIRFYLGEEPLLENVQTWRCAEEEDLKYVLSNLAELVVKEVHGSGGYGMLVGPASTKEEITAYRERIINDPSNFIAQPTLALSTSPTYTESGLVERHVDFRPYCLYGEKIELCPGGLTRVALKKGSLVVNSSQGGGVKDTWVIR